MNDNFTVICNKALKMQGTREINRETNAVVVEITNGIRLKFTKTNEDKVVAIVRFGKDNLVNFQLFFSDDDFIPTLLQGETFFCEFIINRDADLQRLFDRLRLMSNCSEKITKFDGLVPVSKPDSWFTSQAKQEEANRLVLMLNNFRVIEVRGSAFEVIALVTAFPPMGLSILEIRVDKLSVNFAAILTQIQDMASLDGILILIHCDVLTDQQFSDLLVVLGRLNLQHHNLFGAYFIVFGQRKTTFVASDQLPCLSLSSFGNNKETKEFLEIEGIESLRRNQLTAARLIENHNDLETIKDYFYGEKKKIALKNNYANKHPPDNTHLKNNHIDIIRLKNWKKDARQILDKNLVGLSEIKDCILECIISWYLQSNGPLVLLLCGHPGVGKNLLLENLATILCPLFDIETPHYVVINADSLIHKTGFWQLTGVQSGLIGSDNPGILASIGEGSVFTIDEIDKAQDYFFQNFLLNYIDSGYRNGYGEFIPTPRCIVALTANDGIPTNEDYIKSKPLHSFLTVDQQARQREAEIKRYKKTMEKILLPALRSRIHETIYFFSPTINEATEMVRLTILRMLDELNSIGIQPEIILHQEVVAIVNQLDLKLGLRGVVHEVERLRAKLITKIFNEPLIDENK